MYIGSPVTGRFEMPAAAFAAIALSVICTETYQRVYQDSGLKAKTGMLTFHIFSPPMVQVISPVPQPFRSDGAYSNPYGTNLVVESSAAGPVRKSVGLPKRTRRRDL